MQQLGSFLDRFYNCST